MIGYDSDDYWEDAPWVKRLTFTRNCANVKMKGGDCMEGYYSVSEYARIMGKDPGNIRRNLINGKIRGEKIGKQWVIPKDATYPKDNRVKSGKYQDWRKLIQIRRNNPDLMKALIKMCGELGAVYGSMLERIILYGSYARGEETIESDVDIALILNGVQSEKIHDLMTDIVVDYELEQGVTLSVISIDKGQYQQWNSTLPFYKNISKEGIVLWKTA